MIFLNPFALIGLIGAAIPLLLHLFNRRKLRTIEFSTLSFLKELQRTRIRRVKIRQIILLILRTFLIILLVFAFSRPTLRGTHQLLPGSKAKTTAVIVLDDSRSMTAADEKGEYFKQAQLAASAIFDLLDEQDEVYVYPLSSARRQTAASLFPDSPKRATRNTIDELKPTWIFSRLNDAVRASAEVFHRSVHFQKEFYVISDLQESLFEPLGSRSEKEIFPLSDVHTFVIPVGARKINNLGIDSVWIPNAIVQRGKPISVRTKVTNYGDKDAKDQIISLFVGGTRISQQGIDIRSASSQEIEFTTAPQSSGWLDGFVELEEDELPFDNKRFFTLRIPERIRILLVGAPAETRYIKLALLTRQNAGSAIEIVEASSAGLNQALLREKDVIVFCGVDRIPFAIQEPLREFLENGRGLLLFPGSQIDPEIFNASLAKPLSLPYMQRIESIPVVQLSERFASSVEFERIEWRHPVFEGMFEKSEATKSGKKNEQPQTIEAPHIKTFVRFQQSSGSFPIISLSTGAPFLFEQKIGFGRALIFGTSATPDWSDFPMKGLFVPLVHQAITYLAGRSLNGDATHPGEELVFKDILTSSGSVTVSGPHGTETLVPTIRSGLSFSAKFVVSDEIGIFSVKSKDDVLGKFAVNISKEESRLVRGKEDMIHNFLTNHGIQASNITTVAKLSDLQRIVTQTRHGIELWKYFLIAALLIGLVELLIARTHSQELADFSHRPSEFSIKQ